MTAEHIRDTHNAWLGTSHEEKEDWGEDDDFIGDQDPIGDNTPDRDDYNPGGY